MLRDCGEADDLVLETWYEGRCVGGCGGGDR